LGNPEKNSSGGGFFFKIIDIDIFVGVELL